MVKFIELLDLMLTIGLVWLVLNLIHAFVTADKHDVANAFFSLSTWLKKKKNGGK